MLILSVLWVQGGPAECYVEGKMHTNSIEKFLSLLKRGIEGT